MYYNISSTGTTTKHVFLGNQIIATVEGDGTATSTYYIHTDHLTGSNAISDSTGDIVQLLDYYPYGDARIDTQYSSFDEQRQYTGHEHDDDTDLEYANARYYNANVGRFISVDPVYRSIGNDNEIKEKTNQNLQKILENPQILNTQRTMEKSNSASEFGWRKNTLSKNNLTFTLDEYPVQYHNWDRYLVNPQLQNSYSYAANNPLKYVDPQGETPALALPLVIPATEAIIAAAGTAIVGVTSYIMSQNITWDPGRQITPRIFNDSAPDETNLFPNGMPPKWPQWKKAATAIGIGVAAIGTLIYEKYQSMKESVQKVEDTQKAIDRQNQYKDGPVWRNDPRRETIRSAD